MKNVSTLLNLLLSIVLFLSTACNSGCTTEFVSYDEVGDGTSGNPYQIWNETQWQDIGASACGAAASADCGAHFRLMVDLDFASHAGVNVIGSDAHPFSGSFDGNHNTISHVTISSGADKVGVFGRASGAELHDLGVREVTITGNLQVGGLVGYAHLTEITNCHVQGGTVSGLSSVGGLVGYLWEGQATECFADVVAEADGNQAGGLVGIGAHTTIQRSYALGDARSVNGEQVGGFIGLSGAALSHDDLLGNSISDCYAHGSADGQDLVGGFAGVSDTSSFENCYAIGAVTGAGPTLAGFLAEERNPVTNIANFWDTSTSGISTPSGIVGITGTSTASMQSQSTFDPPWDFTSTWQLVPGNYPELR